MLLEPGEGAELGRGFDGRVGCRLKVGCGCGEVSCFLRDVRDGGWKIGRGRDALELRAT
jgi:hypothetical protein